MTRNEILNMPAGREMDALVAEKVMGWSRGTYHSDGVDYLRDPEGTSHLNVPQYSTDIAAAWQVVEKIRTKYPVIRISTGDLMGKYWQCHMADAWREVSHEDDSDWFANAPTAPLAICRAALLAVMDSE